MNGCHGTVAVVGNGPLREEDRRRIRSEYDCVVRFNDLKNYRDGEPVTVHATRFARGTFPGIDLLPHALLLPIATDDAIVDAHLGVHAARLLPTLHIREPVTETSTEEREHRALFAGCDACLSGQLECTQSSTTSGPSAGAAVIDHLERTPSVDAIHVYGMNWNGGKHHVDFVQPDLVPTCCHKCTIHPTASDDYLPSRDGWFAKAERAVACATTRRC
jgi:hypothetical protein